MLLAERGAALYQVQFLNKMLNLEHLSPLLSNQPTPPNDTLTILLPAAAGGLLGYGLAGKFRLNTEVDLTLAMIILTSGSVAMAGRVFGALDPTWANIICFSCMGLSTGIIGRVLEGSSPK